MVESKSFIILRFWPVAIGFSQLLFGVRSTPLHVLLRIRLSGFDLNFLIGFVMTKAVMSKFGNRSRT